MGTIDYYDENQYGGGSTRIRKESVMVKFIIKIGLAKNTAGANFVLTITAILFFVLSFWIFRTL